MTSFRDWLMDQLTDKNPMHTGITGADFVARFARYQAGWETAEQLHHLLHPQGDEVLCDALAEARDEYATTVGGAP